MERLFKEPRLRFLLGDVRDKNRLKRAMNGVDIVVHAAALKHVPVCEYNPIEAVKTNIDGAVNVIDAAIDNYVEKVITISTDKAVQPVNLYGATKMVAEKLFIQGNSYSGDKKTIFSCSRYGNVVGSSGSVVPLFKKQKEKGEITITDEKMTRFWITLDDGVRFVIKCIEEMKGGEIFVPKISSMKIMDLAEAVAPEAKKTIIGIRPGEKLHEILFTAEESSHTKEFDDYFIIEPEFPFWDKENHKEGKLISNGFVYSSDKNTDWLDKDKIKEI
jgi:UDP-N-acetylglucosamine 4,6-dehydratase (inverting)